MASNRIAHINEEMQRVLSEKIRELKDPRISGLISITNVDTTPDLRYARVFVSVLEQDKLQNTIKGLKSASGYLRREVGAQLQLRYTPELQFVADDSIAYGAHIFDILNKLDIREDQDEQE